MSRMLRSRLAFASTQAVAIAVCGVVVGMIAGVLWRGHGELIRAGFYTQPPNIAGPGSGAAPQIINTVYIVVMSLLVTLPLGIAAGSWFAEYAGDGRFTNILRRSTETLATLPSIVVGLFGYAVFVQALHGRPSRLAASLSLVVINLPYAVRITEDALRALPAATREASAALGATRWQTLRRVLLPGALPGLITGVVLLAGRAFGEAAVILFAGSGGAITTAGNAGLDPGVAGDSLAVGLYVFRTQAEPAAVPDAVAFADGIAALLIVVVLMFNLGARAAGRYAVRRLQGE